MQFLDRYGVRYMDKYNVSPDTIQELAMYKGIVNKIKQKYGLKSNVQVASLLGYSKNRISEILLGKKKPPQMFLPALCFYAGITFEDLFEEYEDKSIDDYHDAEGNLIINGIKVDKLRLEDLL